jgi:opacity protein-like surface antigen
MKNTFMVTVAAAALLAGLGMASAQSNLDQRPPAASEETKPQEPASGMQAPSSDAKSETSGQAAPSAEKDIQKSGSDAQPKSAAQPSTSPDSSSPAAQGQTTDSSGTAVQTQSSSAAPGSVTLSTEQRTRIRETVIRSSDAPRVSSVNFSLSVGTEVPRTVRFARLPSMIIEINPAWREYEYFIVGDQLVIVDPRTLRIVAILMV